MNNTPRPPFPRSDAMAIRVTSGRAKVVALTAYQRTLDPAMLRPADNPPPLALGLFSSLVSAGFPSPADDYIEGQLDLNDYLIRHPSATFYVRVTGESMSGAGIFPNDLLVVDRALEAHHGAIVVAVVNGELTVKRLYRKGRAVELHSENPIFPAITFDNDMHLVVWGVVSGVIRKF